MNELRCKKVVTVINALLRKKSLSVDAFRWFYKGILLLNSLCIIRRWPGMIIINLGKVLWP